MQEHYSNEPRTSRVIAAALPRDSQEKHKRLIRNISELHSLETSGFWRAVKALYDEQDWWDFDKRRFLPDAYKIDRENETIEIHEAVVTNPPSRNTLLEMGAFWFSIDCEGWDVRLFLHRLDGTTPAEICLTHWYMEIVRETVERRAIDRAEGYLP